MRILSLLILLVLLPFTALAQTTDRSRAILVMDGSGSMWGQIDGEAKITIAQGVVGDLLGTLPEEMDLGLTVYGHRRKGDCSDIETVVQPGADTQTAITQAVNGIKPKGKTPMTDAIKQAALALRYTEEKATVILVSDGIETCAPDPCAAARALEEAGVDFTAHVIGFDVTDTEALRQMQCLADETGGTFLSVANAAELSTAMTTVVAATPEPEPESQPVEITFNATDGENGPVIKDALVWDLSTNDAPVGDTQNVSGFTQQLLPGEYRIEVLRPADEATAQAVFGVGEVTKTVTVALPEFCPAATLEAAASAIAGSQIPVRWTGPNAQNDYISVARLDDKGYENYAYIKEGSPLDLLMPSEPGSYELRYVLNAGSKVLASLPITITEVTATLTAEGTLPAGGKGAVSWTGPNYPQDYIAVSKPGEAGYETYTYTKEGSPLDIQLPSEPGTYELRYVMRQDARVLASLPIEIAAVTATITPPEVLSAGSTVQVRWTGPNDPQDYIAIFPAGENGYASYTYTKAGSPLDLKLPSEPGPYEIAYVQRQGSKRLGSVAVEVTAVTASLSPVGTLSAGGSGQIEWTGPNDPQDYIAIYPVGENGYTAYTYTKQGSPLNLQLPPNPGQYEIAYVQRQGSNQLVRIPVTVEPVSASVAAKGPLPAGGSVQVDWQGPDNPQDYIALFPAGEDKYVSYTYTRNGSPLDVRLPSTPGSYEMAYVLSEGRTVLTSIAVTVTPVTATVTPPASLPAGSTAQVVWEGPDDPQDYIAVLPVGGTKQVSYVYTKRGSPAALTLPAVPGDYEIAYVQNQDRNVLTRVAVTVSPVSSTVTPPAELTAGSIVEIPWDGPNDPQDFIALLPRDGTKQVKYAYTKNGNPAKLQLPDVPGDYDIGYVQNVGRTIIARVPVEVK